MQHLHPYSVDCVCGKRLPVQLSQAGSRVRCTCGADVDIPRRSELRAGAGECGIESDPVYLVQRAFADDTASVGDGTCIVCRQPTSNRAGGYVECEHVWLKKTNSLLGSILLGAMTTPLVSIMHVLWPHEEKTEGEAIVCQFPISVCPGCAKRRLRINTLRRALESDARFGELFTKYPRARVRIIR